MSVTQPLQILQQCWGFSSFKGEQENIINAVLAKKDVLALLPTGGGKSICFQLPALLMDGVCLVISPLIALMKDQVENLQKRKIAATAIYSGMSFHEIKKKLQQTVNGEYKFLYLSPERLETNLFIDFLAQINVCLIAVDEAHCISQWGYDFRPPYLNIAQLRNALPKTPFIALTASATPIVQKDIVEKLQLLQPKIFLQSFNKPNLSFSVFKVDSKITKLIEILNNVQGSSIVYCNNRKTTKQLAQQLQQHGFNADYYHAGLSQQDRNAKQDAWIKNNIRIIVCTNAFGMGIDKPDVRNVIHYNITDCLENYYQEAGRAGRDGKIAFAVLLYQTNDLKKLAELVDEKFPSFDEVKKVYQSIADYLQIPVGVGEGSFYNFNLQDFCSNFKHTPSLAINVLKLLEQQGHLSFSENIFIPSKVIFTADKNVVNDIENSHPQLDTVMKALLRMYEGIYENYVSINEKLIAKVCRITYDKVYADLKKLHGYGVIDYVPQKETPQIYFILNRASAKHLHLDTTLYNKRKKLYQQKIDKVIEYINLEGCRNKFLANYFGDADAKNCLVCDNCLKEKKHSINEVVFRRIESDVYKLIQHNNCSMNYILENLKHENRKTVWAVINFLIAEDKIMVDENKMVSKN